MPSCQRQDKKTKIIRGTSKARIARKLIAPGFILGFLLILGMALFYYNENCMWSWATKPLPALSEQVQTALNQAEIKRVSVSVGAFGENCIGSTTRIAKWFVIMETDFMVTLTVEDLANRDTLGDLTAQVLAVLVNFPPDKTPGPRPGSITLNFISEDQKVQLRFTTEQAAKAQRQGLRGTALMEALGHH